MSNFTDVRDFHEKFGIDYAGDPRELPGKKVAALATAVLEHLGKTIHGHTDGDLAHFRAEFLVEELTEYFEAVLDGDLEGALDALVDLVYVAHGTAVLHGFDFDEAWNRVHTANMAKVRGTKREDSKRGSTYDVVKPEGWTPPDLSDLVVPQQLELGFRPTEGDQA